VPSWFAHPRLCNLRVLYWPLSSCLVPRVCHVHFSVVVSSVCALVLFVAAKTGGTAQPLVFASKAFGQVEEHPSVAFSAFDMFHNMACLASTYCICIPRPRAVRAQYDEQTPPAPSPHVTPRNVDLRRAPLGRTRVRHIGVSRHNQRTTTVPYCTVNGAVFVVLRAVRLRSSVLWQLQLLRDSKTVSCHATLMVETK